MSEKQYESGGYVSLINSQEEMDTDKIANMVIDEFVRAISCDRSQITNITVHHQYNREVLDLCPHKYKIMFDYSTVGRIGL